MISTSLKNPILDRLSRLYANKRLAHAYLFVGPLLTGKTKTALELARLVNCETLVGGLPCGMCASCLKIGLGNHPDVYVINKEEAETIKIDDVRALLERMQLTAFEGKKKVFIIRNIETFTLEAANALLKTLEEPSSNSLIILTTTLPEACLETIKSRCHKVNFYPLGQQVLANRLENDYHVPSFEAGFLAYFADGSLGQAQKLHEDKFYQLKNNVLEEFLYSPKIDDFVKKLAADKMAVKYALAILYGFFRDCLLVKQGVGPMGLVNQDRIKDIHKFEGQLTFEDLTSVLKEIVTASKLVQENLSVKTALVLIKEMI